MRVIASLFLGWINIDVSESRNSNPDIVRPLVMTQRCRQ
jgi:hypothetical protein